MVSLLVGTLSVRVTKNVLAQHRRDRRFVRL